MRFNASVLSFNAANTANTFLGDLKTPRLINFNAGKVAVYSIISFALVVSMLNNNKLCLSASDTPFNNKSLARIAGMPKFFSIAVWSLIDNLAKFTYVSCGNAHPSSSSIPPGQFIAMSFSYIFQNSLACLVNHLGTADASGVVVEVVLLANPAPFSLEIELELSFLLALSLFILLVSVCIPEFKSLVVNRTTLLLDFFPFRVNTPPLSPLLSPK
mmetsp:Transcript_5728/g.16844  ORF Transcript_5728/g.16844 Transcript_5728/m.16844 type:complete len:215 (-) Transcript_5728:330-974(-)